MTHRTASLPESLSTESLTQELLKFRDERSWAQFHTLRNLIVSLNLEASELLELTQWKNEEEMDALISDSTAHEALRGSVSPPRLVPQVPPRFPSIPQQRACMQAR